MPRLFVLFATMLLPSVASATLSPDSVRSTARTELPGDRNDPVETCFVLEHAPGGAYSARDVRHESELCTYNVDVNVAACPKINSTNPGVNFFTPPPGMSIEAFEEGDCTAKGGEKVAKYKVSLSCSYTPSMIAYYHLSRALQGAANVPVVVLRTLGVDRYSDYAKWAIKLLRDKKEHSIYGWWQQMRDELRRGRSSEMANYLFTDSFDLTYGGFQRNPEGEVKYKAFNGEDGDHELEFKDHNEVYAAVSNPATRVGREFTAANVQRLRQLKDAGDFLLLDTLLNQQDRFGNIHSLFRYYYLENGALRIADSLADVPAALRASALKIQELMLKDNDCGVNKEPRIKRAQLLDGVAHMDPRTYAAFLALDRSIDSQKDWFLRALQFNEYNFKNVAQNVHEAAKLLRGRCESGALALDLDPALHFSGAALPAAPACAQ